MHPNRRSPASQSQPVRKITFMRKLAFFLAAFVLFAPVAYAALRQAALMVA
jgi:hypothetical protein